MAERIGLSDHRMRAAGALSHGAQRQLEVGLVLCTNPKLMLLDEPMAGMGPDESQRMVELLKSLRGNTTIVLVEHDMDAVFRLADTISVLVSGRVVASGNAEQIKNDVAVQHAYLGDA
jgi:branched-chain amino acid transport system ATP-binding protein